MTSGELMRSGCTIEPIMVSQLRSILWLSAVLASAVTAIGCYAAGLSLNGASWIAVPLCALALGIGLTRAPASSAQMERLFGLIECFLLYTLFSALGALLSYLAMRWSHGFTDALLDRADHAIGFDWLGMHRSLQHRPFANKLLQLAYVSCFIAPLIVLIGLFLTNRIERMYRFVTAYGAALVVTIVIFYFFPARAAFEYYLGKSESLPSNAVQYGKVIFELRSGSLAPIDLSSLAGIVTFPSFHAAMGVLFIWASWPIRALRQTIVLINIAMIASAVPVGGHYMIDILGGALVALASVYAVQRFLTSNKSGQRPGVKKRATASTLSA